VTHFHFMDDVLLFYHGSWIDVFKLKGILDLYCTHIGVKVNL
jgi:hypothetical protein